MNETEHVQTPECDKLAKVSNEKSVLIDFVDWLGQRGIWLGRFSESRITDFLEPINESTDTLLNAYFQIDAAKLEKERRALLEWMRRQHDLLCEHCAGQHQSTECPLREPGDSGHVRKRDRD